RLPLCGAGPLPVAAGGPFPVAGAAAGPQKTPVRAAADRRRLGVPLPSAGQRSGVRRHAAGGARLRGVRPRCAVHTLAVLDVGEITLLWWRPKKEGSPGRGNPARVAGG